MVPVFSSVATCQLGMIGRMCAGSRTDGHRRSRLLNNNPDPKFAYSIEEAAELLSIKRDSIHELLNTGELGSFKIGTRRLITHRHLEAFIETKVA